MKKSYFWLLWLGAAIALLSVPPAFASAKVTKLAKKLLYGDSPTRLEAIKAFNKLPADEQYTLVPDFMVALTDDNPEVRKIAARILKAMGVTTESQIPDAKKELPSPPSKAPPGAEQWTEEKKLRETKVPDAAEKRVAPPPKSTGEDQWADLKKMRGDESGNYADMRREIDREKKTQVTLDPSELRSDPAASATPLSTVVESLKDPDPWVRAQAARRLALVHPAPVETIPTLIGMLGDKDVESRRGAAAALGSFGPLAREAIPALIKTLADSDNGVSLIAAEALKQIQQPQ